MTSRVVIPFPTQRRAVERMHDLTDAAVNTGTSFSAYVHARDKMDEQDRHWREWLRAVFGE